MFSDHQGEEITHSGRVYTIMYDDLTRESPRLIRYPKNQSPRYIKKSPIKKMKYSHEITGNDLVCFFSYLNLIMETLFQSLI